MEIPKVLITRSSVQASGFAVSLQNLGIQPIYFPTIETTEPISWLNVDETISRLQDFSDIAFTSANGVRFFLGRCKFLGIQFSNHNKFFTVGKKTNAALAEFGIDSVIASENSSALGLAELIIAELDSSSAKILFPCGNLSDGTLMEKLRKNDFSIEKITVYQTILPKISEQEIEEVRTLVLSQKISVISFFSPSGVKNFLSLFPDFSALLGGIKIAVIGETTANECRNSGLIPNIILSKYSSETSSENLAKLIFESLKSKNDY